MIGDFNKKKPTSATPMDVPKFHILSIKRWENFFVSHNLIVIWHMYIEAVWILMSCRTTKLKLTFSKGSASLANQLIPQGLVE